MIHRYTNRSWQCLKLEQLIHQKQDSSLFSLILCSIDAGLKFIACSCEKYKKIRQVDLD